MVRAGLLAGLFVLLAGCARETVAHRQIERTANRILVLLRESGIGARKVRDEAARDLRFDVTVGAVDAPRALAVLEAHDLPQPPQPSSRDMIEASGMIPTEREGRMKQTVGLEGDIVNALRQVPGVTSVQAAVSVPRPDPLATRETTARAKASVLVILRPGEGPELSVEDVQRFVQAKLPELEAADVDVVLLSGGPGSARAGGVGSVAPDEGRCAPTRRWGVRVCADSEPRLASVVAGSILTTLALALVAAWMAWRSAASRHELARVRLAGSAGPSPGGTGDRA